jgi:purine-binding chemotaxis protein CheW
LSFELAGSHYALLMSYVHEVVRAVAIQPLEHAPTVVSGVFNLRGQVIPVIDMRRRLGLEPKPVSPEDFFLVVDVGRHRVALHVDRALDLLEVTPTPIEQIAPAPYESVYVAGVVPTSDGVLLIHDLPRFLSHLEAMQLSHALAESQAPAGGPA